MSEMPQQHFAPGFKIEPADADRNAIGAKCFTRVDGVHFCPSLTGMFGLWGSAHVLLTMEIGSNGLFIAWTPEGTRLSGRDPVASLPHRHAWVDPIEEPWVDLP